MESERVGTPVYAGVFLISLASLALEILQMRLFAFVLWHHLAFLVVSIAILGFGAAGAFLSVARWLGSRDLQRSVAVAGLLFMASAFVGPLALVDKPIDVFDQIGRDEILQTGLYYLLFALPYFFAGYVISIALTQGARDVSKLYFANMVGSGLGCFALFAILAPLGAEGALVAIAALGAVVTIIAGGRLLRPVGGIALLACIAGMIGVGGFSAKRIFAFRPVSTKFIRTYTEHGQDILATRWSTLGRIDIVADPTVGAHDEKGACLFQDGDAPGQMPHRDWVAPAGQIHAIAYAITQKPDVLVIGIGGGLDLKIATDFDAKSIKGVEINPQTLALYRTRFKDLTGDLESRPNVTLFAAEGRNFVRSSNEKFDLIQMSGVDTYTALANGAYVLSESYLYTREAFDDYYDHLEDDGLLAIIRFAWPKPRETLRAVVIAFEALRARGVEEPWKHVAVLKNGRGQNQKTKLGAILVKKSAFTKADLDALRRFADAGAIKYSTDYLPDETGDSAFHRYADSFEAGRDADFLASYPFKITPVTDDAPFFFAQHRWSSVWDWLWSEKKAKPKLQNPVWAALLEDFQKQPVGLILLALTLGQLAVLVALGIFVPLLFLKKPLAGTSAKAPLGYFLCLGLAYIFLMISAMQRFGLVLGHPTYAITVTMATFLIGSGLGSLVSGRVAVKHGGKLLFTVALVLVLAAAALQIWFADLSAWLLSRGFATRVATVVGVLFPIAFMMGTCFPTGIRALAGGREALIPWAYGVNGGASVLGSVATVCLAMALGFANVQWIATGLYVLAWLLMVRMLRERDPGYLPGAA